MGCFLLKELFLSFTFSLYWFCIFFRICLLPHFHGFIFILFILLRKKTNTIFVWFLYKIQNKATSAKIHLNHFYIIKYFLYSFLKSDFSHSEIPSHQKFQSIHRTNIFSRIFSTFLYTCKFCMNQRKNNHHFISLTLIWTWKKNR